MRIRFSLICGLVIMSFQRTEAQAKPLALDPSLPLLQGVEAPLKGMRNFVLQIFADSAYPDTAGLRTSLELKMRQAGMSPSPTATSRVMFVCLASRISTLPIRFAACTVQVRDIVYRLEPRRQRFLAIVWESQRSLTTGDNHFAESYKGLALSTFDELMNDWYKANQAP